MRPKHMFFLFVAFALLMGLIGCSAPEPAGLSEPQATATAENILKAIDANDYPKFSLDFSDKMKSALTEQEFVKLQTMLHNASGNYVSIGTPTISNNQGYAIYRFPTKYTNETVSMTITFLVGGKTVEGLFFDSVNLRKAPQ